MKVQTTRFIISFLAIMLMAALAFFAMIKGDSVTPPLCVTGIGGVAGYYTYGKTQNNKQWIEAQKPCP
jgi:hypothetical protein